MAKSYGLDQAGEQVNVKRSDAPGFFPEDLIENTENYRFGAFDVDPEVMAAREREIEEMVISLCTEGQKQQIIIRPVPGKRFMVLAGDTRHKAGLRINQRRIWPWANKDDNGRMRLDCRVEEVGDKEAFGASIIENAHRNQLTPICTANAVRIASDKYKYTDAEIMAKFRQADPAWLPNMRRLAVLPAEIQRLIHLGKMAPSVGYVLAEIPQDRHAEVLAEAAQGVKPIQIETPLEVSTETPEQTTPAAEPAPAATAPKARKARSKVTARSVAAVAKSKGLLKHKAVSLTVAGQREFWNPLARPNSLLGKLAEANLAWLTDADHEKFYKAVIAVLKKEIK